MHRICNAVFDSPPTFTSAECRNSSTLGLIERSLGILQPTEVRCLSCMGLLDESGVTSVLRSAGLLCKHP